jgi:adenosine deaminase
MTNDLISTLPKAVLHDHLDGGVRVSTILEIADEEGYRGLPASNEAELQEWFKQGRSGSLVRYLEAFEQTIAVMQTPDAIRRVAYEAGMDLAADGTVYAEIRFAPSQHRLRGLTREAVIEAVLDGFGAAQRESGIVLYAIIDAMRQDTDSEDVVAAAAKFLNSGVVAFDLAGPEAGFPADDYIVACRAARDVGLGLTIHAGEADGPVSIWRAIARCGAQRVGHGVRIVDETTIVDGEIVDLAPLARRVRDHRIPLEVAITSNLDTSAFPNATEHPFGALYRGGFAVTINTDNRLMSGASLSDEYRLARDTYALSYADLGTITETALRAGFGDWPTRRRLLADVVRPAYLAAERSSTESNQPETSSST